MFDMYAVGAVAGAGALSYLAASPKNTTNKDGKRRSLRFSLDKKQSLIADVRVLGGVGCLGAAYFVENKSAKEVLMMGALAMAASVVSTELVRYRLQTDADGKTDSGIIDNDDAWIPGWEGYGKIAGGDASRERVRERSWAA